MLGTIISLGTSISEIFIFLLKIMCLNYVLGEKLYEKKIYY